MAASGCDIARLKTAAETGEVVLVDFVVGNRFDDIRAALIAVEVRPLGIVCKIVWRRLSSGREYACDERTGRYFDDMRAGSVRPLFPVIRPWTAEARP